MADDTKDQLLDITPETKIGRLLEKYPHLESELLKLAPAFAKLKNPLLRKTVGKIATLRQAAGIGKVPLATMINTLRRASGLPAMEVIERAASPMDLGGRSAPEWFKPQKITASFDARAMIERGEQPLGHVMKEVSNLESGQIYELMTQFLPAPLIDLAEKKGISIWSFEEKPDLFKTYFCMP